MAVGSLELVVNADTGRLEAQLVKGGTQAGKKGQRAIDRELNQIGGRGLQARLTLVRKQIETSLSNIDLDLNLDPQAIQSELKRIEAQLRAADAELSIDPNFNDSKLREDLVALRALLARQNLDISIDGKVDEGELLALRGLIEATFRDIKVEVEVEVDEEPFATQRQRLFNQAANLGDDLGESVGGAFNSRFAKILGALAIVGEPLTLAIEGLASGALAILGSVSLGAVGGVAALTGAISGLVGVVAGGVVGAAGFGSALSAVNEEMAESVEQGRKFDASAEAIDKALVGLSPQAASAARAFAGLRQGIADAQAEIQEDLFRGLSREISSLGRETIPDMAESLGLAAEKANDFLTELIDIANNTEFTTLFEELEPAMDSLVSGAAAFVRTLEPFLRAAAPATALLARSFERSALSFERFVLAGEESGTLEGFLTRAVESLQVFGQFAGAATTALGTLFSAGQDAGDDYLISLTEIIQRFDAWMVSVAGQEALNEFFDGGKLAVQALQPLLEGLQEAFSVLVTEEARDNLADLSEALGSILPVIAQVISILGDLGLLTALLTILAPLGLLVDAIDAIPAPVLEFVGAFGVAIVVMAKLAAAIKAARIAMIAFSTSALSNPAFLAVAATVAAATVAFKAFRSTNDDLIARTKELTPALDGTVEALLREADAADIADIGIKALNETLTGTGEVGAELTKQLGRVGLEVEDATATLVALKDEPVEALVGLADNLGFTGDKARFLAEIVNATEGSFTTATLGVREMADQLGISEAKFVEAANKLEDLQVQADNTSFDTLIRSSLETAIGLGGMEKEAALAALGTKDLADVTGTDLVPVFDEYVKLLAEADAGLQENTDAIEDQTEAFNLALGAYADTNEAILQNIQVEADRKQALIDAGKAARDAAFEESRLTFAIRGVVSEIAIANGIAPSMTQSFIAIGDAARDASEDAAAFDSVIAVLFGRFLDEGQALDAAQLGLNEFVEKIQEATTESGKYVLSLEGTSTESIQLRDAVRDSVGEITNYISSALEAGTATDVMKENTEKLRAELIENITAVTGNEEAAAEYVATLLGTPDLISTIIEQPGILDALINGEDLTLLYDEAGNPVITKFKQFGIDVSLADSTELKELIEGLDEFEANPSIVADTRIPEVDVDQLQDDVDALGRTIADPAILTSSVPDAVADVEGLQTDFDALGDSEAEPSIELPDFDAVMLDLKDLARDLEELDAADLDIDISLPGIVTRKIEVENLKRAIDTLSNRTITITTRNVAVGGPVGARMAGGLIKSPEVSQLGEFGLREAVIPLQLPLSRVDPEVREMAAMIRGEGAFARGAAAPQQQGPSRVINNTFKITEAERGETTAHQVANRIASSVY